MKNKISAGVLALFFGGFGVHRFYLGQKGLGILYLVFTWTLIPWLIAMIDGIVLLAQSDDTFNLKYNRDYFRAERIEPGFGHERRHRHIRREAPAPAPPPKAARSKSRDPFQESGDIKYRQFDFDGAMADYRKSLHVNPRQPRVHFQLACLHSVHEQTERALHHLDRAMANGFCDFEKIENHDHLAYLRSQPEWLDFKGNGYRLKARQSEAPVDAVPAPPVEERLELSEQLVTSLERLGRLHQEGILNEEAFRREKAKILNGA